MPSCAPGSLLAAELPSGFSIAELSAIPSSTVTERGRNLFLLISGSSISTGREILTQLFAQAGRIQGMVDLSMGTLLAK